MRRYVRGGYTPLSLTLVLTAASGARAALPPQKAASVGRCSVEQVHGLFLEPAQVRPELRVLVASLSGADENALVLGQSVGRRLRAVLESHVRDEIKSDQTGLYADAIRVKFVPCTLDDHEHARAIGESGQADVVLWGEAFCTAQNPRACQTTNININSGNVIQDSPGARMESKSGDVSVRVVQPGTAGRFTTSLTVVRWHGLEGNTATGAQVRRFDQVAALGLPRLVSEQPRLLLDVVLGLYASRAGRHGLAAEFFERAKKDVAATVAGAAELYRLIGTSYLIAGRKEAGLVALEAALRSCVRTEPRCEATALDNLGWAKDRLGDKKTALSYYERALPLQQKGGDVAGEAGTLNNIGGVYVALGDKKTALSYYERALPLMRKVGDVSGEGTTRDNLALVLRDLGRTADAIQGFRDASSCHLRRIPPDTEEAISSLDLALSLAVRAGNAQATKEVSARLDALDPDDLRKLLRQARTAGRSRSGAATALYQRIAAQAGALPPEPQGRLRAIAQAGLLRVQHQSAWPDCPGILITEVLPASLAESLGLRAGDIALRYQGACLFEPSDLRAEVGKTKPEQSVTLELWRGSAVQTLTAKGGSLGVTLERF